MLSTTHPCRCSGWVNCQHTGCLLLSELWCSTHERCNDNPACCCVMFRQNLIMAANPRHMSPAECLACSQGQHP